MRAFAINATDQQGKFRLTWDWTPDPLEPTAMPTSYIVEERTGSEDEPFRPVGETKKPEFDIYIDPGIIHSYRITAVNGGGRSFPSEVLSAGRTVNAGPMVTVVNAFTRVSGPDRFESGGMAGFGLTDPAGVPWGSELSRTGRQVEFMRSEPWIDDDAPGFGSSGSEWECREIRGNTFDLTVTHGEADHGRRVFIYEHIGGGFLRRHPAAADGCGPDPRTAAHHQSGLRCTPGGP